MSNPIEEIEDWLYTDDCELDPPIEAIEKVLSRARKSDSYIRKIYQVIGFMFKDSCKIMETGLTQTYRDRTVDQVFERVQEALGLPVPLDLAPSLEEIPDAANDLPVIQLIN